MLKIAIDGKEIVNNRETLIGFSNETKPEKKPDGSTFSEVDTGKSFVFIDGKWHEKRGLNIDVISNAEMDVIISDALKN